MALEDGGDGIVCDLGHGVKIDLKWARNGRWRDRWEDKLEGQNRKTGGTKLLPEHTVRVYRKSPKNEVEYRKLTLSV